MALSANAQAAFVFLTDAGSRPPEFQGLPELSPMEAAAVIGNFQQEAYQSLNTTAHNKGEDAYGIGQWRDSRQDGLESYAASLGRDKSDLAAQLGWALTELTTTHKGALSAMRSASTIEEATQAFASKFEVTKHGYDNREANARNVAALAGAPMKGGAAGSGSLLMGGGTTSAPLMPAQSWDDRIASLFAPPAAPMVPLGPAPSRGLPLTNVAGDNYLAYLMETAQPGGTMSILGPEDNLSRLEPTFAANLSNAIAQARAEGIPASVFSGYRAPDWGVGGFADKSNSLHSYGLSVDIAGIGRPGSDTAARWQEIAEQNGLYNPYGYQNAAEWNHYQAVPQKGEQWIQQNPQAREFGTGVLSQGQLQQIWSAAGFGQPVVQTAATQAPADLAKAPQSVVFNPDYSPNDAFLSAVASAPKMDAPMPVPVAKPSAPQVASAPVPNSWADWSNAFPATQTAQNTVQSSPAAPMAFSAFPVQPAKNDDPFAALLAGSPAIPGLNSAPSASLLATAPQKADAPQAATTAPSPLDSYAALLNSTGLNTGSSAATAPQRSSSGPLIGPTGQIPGLNYKSPTPEPLSAYIMRYEEEDKPDAKGTSRPATSSILAMAPARTVPTQVIPAQTQQGARGAGSTGSGGGLGGMLSRGLSAVADAATGLNISIPGGVPDGGNPYALAGTGYGYSLFGNANPYSALSPQEFGFSTVPFV